MKVSHHGRDFAQHALSTVSNRALWCLHLLLGDDNALTVYDDAQHFGSPDINTECQPLRVGRHRSDSALAFSSRRAVA